MVLQPYGRINVTLDKDLIQMLRDEAGDKMTLSELVRSILRDRYGHGPLGNKEPPPRTIGDLAKRLIRHGYLNEEVVEAITRDHPQANTSRASVAWYRSQLRKTESDVPTQTEVRRRRKAGELPPPSG